jgi:Putative auto-transporter adhesin, head GIN domain
MPLRMPNLLRSHRRSIRLLLIAAFVSLGSPLLAAERSYPVTDFERIDITGPYIVTVEAGKSPGARASGSVEALERVTVETQGRILRIKPSQNSWGGWPGAQTVAPTIKVTVPFLREAALSGGGSLTISKMRAQVVRLGVVGSGKLTVAAIDTDKLTASLLGSGIVTLAGKAATGLITSEGTGNIVASSLTVGVLDVSASSAGTAQVTAGRTAKVNSTGAGDITIMGSPACSVKSAGAGRVICGK